MAKNPIGISFDWGRATFYEILPAIKYSPPGKFGDCDTYAISFQWLKWYFEVFVG